MKKTKKDQMENFATAFQDETMETTFTQSQASRIYGCTPGYIGQLLRSGRLEKVRVNGRNKVSARSLKKFIQEKKEGDSAEKP